MDEIVVSFDTENVQCIPGAYNVNIYYCYKVYKYFAKYLFKHDSKIIALRCNYLDGYNIPLNVISYNIAYMTYSGFV